MYRKVYLVQNFERKKFLYLYEFVITSVKQVASKAAKTIMIFGGQLDSSKSISLILSKSFDGDTYIMSISSSSSNSPSSSAVASWYCWYSETRSFMFDSASVNSISSIPSPVYQ